LGSKTRQEAKHVAGFKLDYKPLCSDLMDSWLAVGMSEAKMLLLDLNRLQFILGGATRPFYSESPLGSRTRTTSIKLFKDDQYGIAVSDNSGRVNASKILEIRNMGRVTIALESFITFKGHYQKDENGEYTLLNPINAVGFHPGKKSDFLYSAGGGGEGKMYFWDIKMKDKIAEFDFKGTAVTRAEMDPTGKYLAYSLGYDWSRGIQGHFSHPSKVCVHVMQDKELSLKAQSDQNYPLIY